MRKPHTDPALTELRYRLDYVRDWFTWGMFVQNAIACILGAYYITRRVWLFTLKIARVDG